MNTQMAWSQTSLLLYMAKSEMQRRNSGSVGGIFYIFGTPMILIFVVWFALDVGLGLRALIGPEFGLKLIIGMAVWVAVTDTANDAVYCVVRNPHLVKKVVFPVYLLPLASVIIGTVIHVAVLVVLVFLLGFSGDISLAPRSFPPLFAGLFLLIIFLTGLSLLTSSLNVIVRDTQLIVPVVLSVGFWVTPIIWDAGKVAELYRWFIALNPAALIIEAYRYGLLGTSWPFSVAQTAMGLTVLVMLLFGGALLERVLRPSYADAL